MKHWLNNWEKYIGRRLSNAEMQPDSQIWTRIERELDAELIANRNRTLRRATGLLLLLLLLSSTFLFIGNPSAEKARGSLFIQLEDSPIAGLYMNESTSQEAAVMAVDLPVEQKIVVADMMEDIEEVSFVQPVLEAETLDDAKEVVEVIRERYVLELSEIEVEDQNLEVPLHAFANLPVNSYYQTISVDSRTGGVKLEAPLSEISMREMEHKVRTGKRELMNRIAASTKVESPIMVWNTNADLMVQTQVHTLSGPLDYISLENSAFNEMELAINDLDLAETSYDAVMEETAENLSLSESGEEAEVENVLTEEAETESTEDELTALVPEMEEAEAVQKMSWKEEAMEELASWKEDMEEFNEEAEDELEELIDEAIIEEEDPLTRKQNEAMDLYRSYNVNKGFHIGMVAGFQNTWVTKESRNPEIDRSLVNSKMTPGYQMGINMGYDITDHFGLMMEFKYSDEGGKYYNPVKDRTEHIDLKYFEVPIYVKVKHSKMTDKLRPIVFNYLVGFSYSDLRKVTNTIDGDIERRFGQDYNTSQWGLSAGFDFDLYFHKNFFWTIGTRAGVSGDSKAFPKFKGKDGNSAMTRDAGIYTRLSFRLPGR